MHYIIDRICGASPYIIFLWALAASAVHRKTHSQAPPGKSIFSFWFTYQLFCCALFGVLTKYILPGERPRINPSKTPPGWIKIEIPPGGRNKALTFLVREKAFLQIECPSIREPFCLPMSLSEIKRRYAPGSAMPSTHSIISGYIFIKSVKVIRWANWANKPYQNNQITHLILLFASVCVAASRVIYKHHYPGQVIIGFILGGIFEVFIQMLTH